NYLPELLADNVAMAKIKHFGLHNYADNSAGAAGVLAASAYPDRTFWVTEAGFGFDYYNVERLIAQMKNGAASAGLWDAYASVYNHRPNDGGPMLEWTGTVWFPNRGFYSSRQMAKFAPPGAIRIGAVESGAVSAVAFYHPQTGRITVVGHNTTSGRNLKVSL